MNDDTSAAHVEPEPAAAAPEPPTPEPPVTPVTPVMPVTPAPLDPTVLPELSGGASGLTDGEWHFLHPATPLLRGGIAFIAILGVVIANLRERLIDLVFDGSSSYEGDPIDYVVDKGYVGIALLVVAVVLIVLIVVFYLSWRMHTFRITNEVVEVRSGILFRTNRRGRLDRIQGINIVRPFFARLFGAARLEINVAGQDANVQLAYLSSSNADALRRDILSLASGTRAAEKARDAPAAAAGLGGLLDQRVGELLAPELDPSTAPPESVVKMHTGRLVGSILLSDTTLVFLLIIAGAITALTLTGEPFLIIGMLPVLLGLGSFLVRRFTKSLRYSIADTPDGVRVGFGLLTTSNETLPPGRIHSVQVSQPLLWRPAGWWEVKVNRASQSSTKGADGQQNTTILPVGNLDDVTKVLGLILPGLRVPSGLGAADAVAEIEGDTAAVPADAGQNVAVPADVSQNVALLVRNGLMSRGGADGFVNSPRRAWPLRWFSWRRNGFALGPNLLLLRKGAVWRQLILVPEPRVQSIALKQGPLERALGLAAVHVDTVAGPITAHLGAIDRDAALQLFADASSAVITSAGADTSHRWRSGEVTP
ncbi:PH domain-containing protein [Glaciihabitans sp. dw_435]|uniref:PH domain-containing protein n=1 Tax=Glaciihabitans sp. dw_435 TaxID=2720081 RepID=UPI001BD2B0E3|nr:PH domain-containing protein [Glaciihabitans sp. dw_435]